LINEVNIEDYVAAVVAAEYGFDDLEGAKAMAVIVRTYAMAVINKYGSEYDHVDHTLSQVYRGTEGISPTIREAVRQTRGEVLSYDGELIEAVYFAASGGHTADNDAVWSAEAVPYLRGKPDPYGSSAPQSTWTFRVSRDRLLAALSARYGTVTGFVIDERGKDDRVISIELLKASGRHETIRGNEFRVFVLEHFGDATLRSTLFTADRVGDHYVFEGRGNGHGVGLSQWGAHELAQRNSSYRDILEFYYTGIQLQRLDDLTDAEPPPAAAPSSDPPDSPARSAPKNSRIGW
jgi:stage II sporulation protein D